MILLRDILDIIPKEQDYFVFRVDWADRLVLEKDVPGLMDAPVTKLEATEYEELCVFIDPRKTQGKADGSEKSDIIKKPLHYTFRGVEAIVAVDILTAKATGRVAYLIGCAVKYLYRYPMKNGAQDLDKAIQCLKMLREYLFGKPKD